MRVQVDKAGRDDTARSVQNTLGGLPFQAADLGDLAVLDRDVAHIAGRTRPINDRAAFDDDVVVCHLGDSLMNRHSPDSWPIGPCSVSPRRSAIKFDGDHSRRQQTVGLSAFGSKLREQIRKLG
jgi:hypothetical protein